MNDESREIRAGHRLQAMIANDVNLGPRVRQMLKQGISATAILRELERESGDGGNSN
jgi:hypothetical protein